MVFLLATTFALSFLGLLANSKSTGRQSLSSDDTALGIAAIQAPFQERRHRP